MRNFLSRIGNMLLPQSDTEKKEALEKERQILKQRHIVESQQRNDIMECLQLRKTWDEIYLTSQDVRLFIQDMSDAVTKRILKWNIGEQEIDEMRSAQKKLELIVLDRLERQKQVLH